MAPNKNSQDILRMVWNWFKAIAKYLVVYLVIYAAVKFILHEVLAFGNEGVYATVALISTLLVYLLFQQRKANSSQDTS